MCGINGIVYKNPNAKLSFTINHMNDLITHRGPDDEGLYIYDNRISLGMRRLSIIDIAHGKQPLFNDDCSCVIVFNGEIYNFKTLKYDLEKKGVVFKTSSDTEVILKLYEVYGEKSFEMLEGMFAFCIFDKMQNKVFIVRDRFGEKPLYYFNDKERIIWASELKSIISNFPELKLICNTALNLYLSLTYIPSPYTIYKRIFKLNPGCYLEIDTLNLSIKEIIYWKINPNQSLYSNNYKEAKEELKRLMFDSVEKRMISDVPLGVFLSGGVDSTIVAAIMSKISDTPIKTFSVAYSNPRYDESPRARLVSNHIKSDHHEYVLNFDEILSDLDYILLNYDEPYADSSCLPTYFISKKTVNHVKVALTGDGGDEVFGGYNKYMIHSYARVYEALVPRFVNSFILNKLDGVSLGSLDTKGFTTKLKKFLNSIGNGPSKNHLNIISLGFKNKELSLLLTPGLFMDIHPLLLRKLPDDNQLYWKESPLKLSRFLDMHISLEGDMLVKVDRASMLCSLECRAPFLDHRLMEFSFRIPDNFLIKGYNKKRILKDTFKYLLPENFFNSPKSGFEVPISDWFRNELKTELIYTLSEGNIRKHNLFQNEYVQTLIQQHIYQRIDQSTKLWTLFCFQKWYNHNFDH